MQAAIRKGVTDVVRDLPPWCKRAKIRMIEKDIRPTDLANELGMTRSYVSSILNGRVIAEPAIKRISTYLEIRDTYDK